MTADGTPTGLLAYVEAERGAKARLCKYARARASMAEEMRKELDFMVESPEYSDSVIFRALNANGFHMSRDTVVRHLAKECGLCR